MLTKVVNGVTVPLTAEEEKAILAEWDANAIASAAIAYKSSREQAYPTPGDQLDAIWKLVQANPAIVIPLDVQPVIDQINLVKAEYPKPVSV